MPTFETQVLIDSLRAQLSEINEDLNEIFNENDTTDLKQKPNEKAWSAIECIQHLYLTNKYYLPKLEKVLKQRVKAEDKLTTSFKSGYFGQRMYKSLAPDNGEIKKKIPTFGSVDPSKKYAKAALDIEKVKVNILKQQKQLEDLLALAETVGLGKGRVPSLIGPIMSFKPGDVFRILLAHEARHMIQAKNAIPIKHH